MAINFTKEQLKKSGVEADDGKDKEKTGLIKKIDNYLLKFSRVPLKEKLFLVQHLGIMLKAGISLSSALKTLAVQTKNKYLIVVLNNTADSVEKGNSFADSLKPYDDVFGELFVSMINAGEISGKLEEVLHQLYIQMKKDHGLISKVKGALTYPAVIVLAMLGIGAFMIIFVIPKITQMFEDIDAELPIATKILITVSDAIINNGIASAIIFIVIVITLAKILKTTKGKYYFQALLLAMPIISPIVKKINLARFSRNISSLLKTDIMIIKTFQITANVIGNLHYRYALQDMAQQIKKGGKISEVIKSYPKLFTPIVAQMVAVGEDTGELDNILVELAEFYEEEIDQIMENLPSIIEPLLLLALGVGVGGVAVAILMPMYSLTSSI